MEALYVSHFACHLTWVLEGLRGSSAAFFTMKCGVDTRETRARCSLRLVGADSRGCRMAAGIQAGEEFASQEGIHAEH